MNESENRAQSMPPLDDARISGAISKILEHPELIGMIGSMLSNPKPTANAPVENRVDEPPEPPQSAPVGSDMLSALAPMLAKLQGSASSLPHKDDRRERLLIALKPYLSSERCEAIDQMLKISRISDVFKNMS